MEIDRRELFLFSAAVPAAVLIGSDDYQPIDPEILTNHVMRRFSLSKGSAFAMVKRANIALGEMSSILIGQQNSVLFDSSENQLRKSWSLSGKNIGADKLKHAMAIGCPKVTRKVSNGRCRLRWISSCTFSNVTGHLFRHVDSAAFVIVPKKDIEIPASLGITMTIS